MNTTKIFKNGRSQAVRLPKEYRFDSDEVYIKKFEHMVLLIPKNNPWKIFFDSLEKFSDDFMNNRNQPMEQKRNKL
jgi:antitoxin VapB